MPRKSAAVLALAVVALVALIVLPAAFAGKGGNGPSGGGGGGKPSGGGGSLSLVMVVDNTGNDAPDYGDTVTFNVTTGAERPYVSVHCYQGGSLVYAASAGFYADYPWSTNFGLRTTTWTSGGADCTAKLYTTKDGSRITTLATLNFVVGD